MLLEKLYVGDVATGAGEAQAVTFQQPPEHQQFYHVLRQRVERHFRKNEVIICTHCTSALLTLPTLNDKHSPSLCNVQICARGSSEMYIKSALIMLGLATSFYASFFGGFGVVVRSTSASAFEA